MSKSNVLIVLGSDEDLEKFEDCFFILDKFGICYTICEGSPYFNQDEFCQYIREKTKNDVEIIISGSAENSYLAGAVASICSIPVIGVPIRSKNESSVKSMLPIIEMPKGVPIASVGINSVANAALLTVQILAIKDIKLKKQFQEYKKYLALRVKKKDELLQQICKKEGK